MYGTAISEITWKLAEQIFYNYGYKEKATLKWGRGVRLSLVRTYPNPHSPCSDSQVGGISQLQRSSPKSEGVWVAWGTCTTKRSRYNIWLWKLSGLTSGRDKGLEETQIVLFLSPGTEVTVRKAPRSYMKVIHWLIWGCVLKGQGSVGSPESEVGDVGGGWRESKGERHK